MEGCALSCALSYPRTPVKRINIRASGDELHCGGHIHRHHCDLQGRSSNLRKWGMGGDSAREERKQMHHFILTTKQAHTAGPDERCRALALAGSSRTRSLVLIRA